MRIKNLIIKKLRPWRHCGSCLRYAAGKCPLDGVPDELGPSIDTDMETMETEKFFIRSILDGNAVHFSMAIHKQTTK